MLSLLRNKTIFLTIITMIISLFLFNSCGKKEEQQKPVVSQKIVDTLFNEENLKKLENSYGLEFILLIKKYAGNYLNLIPKPSQFESVADRKKMLIRFGMMTTDIAYAKIVGGKTQMPEYEKTFEKYVKELNLNSIVKSKMDEYLILLSGRELEDTVYNELKTKIVQARIELINKVKELDEEFLVYYFLGVAIELNYITVELIKADKSNAFNKKIFEFFNMADSHYHNFYILLLQHPIYKDYSSKIKDAFDTIEINGKNMEKQIQFPQEEIDTKIKIFSDFREEILK